MENLDIMSEETSSLLRKQRELKPSFPLKYKFLAVVVVASVFVFGLMSNGSNDSQSSKLSQEEEEIITPFGKLPTYCVRAIPKGKIAKKNAAGLIEILDQNLNVESTHVPDSRCMQFKESMEKTRELKLKLKSDSQKILSKGEIEPSTETTTESTFSEIDGWLDYVYYWPSSYVASFEAYYTVPTAPTLDNDQVLFYFIGTENLESDDISILQPVLTYNNGIPGWNMASWNCCPDGEAWVSDSIAGLNVGDVMYGSISIDEDYATIVSTTYSKADGSATGESVTLEVATDDRYFNWLDVTLEVYGVTECSEFSSSTMSITSMVATDIDGNTIESDWTDATGTTLCSGSQTYSQTTWENSHSS